ncbi:hypothetical protein ABFW07_10210 [Acinetobacter soli]|uniref:hypothetical protein n=1 Tax=Acinetobacter soli TaxID=487316 RepID=UPI003218C2B1
MDHVFGEDIKKTIAEQLGHTNGDMATVCFKLFDYIANDPTRKMHLTFIDLYNVVSPVNENLFYSCVFFLTRKDIDVLTQKFEAWNNNRSRWQVVPDLNEIIIAISEKDYFNPFSGDPLDEVSFSKQVVTFFSPSETIIQRYKNAN